MLYHNIHNNNEYNIHFVKKLTSKTQTICIYFNNVKYNSLINSNSFNYTYYFSNV